MYLIGLQLDFENNFLMFSNKLVNEYNSLFWTGKQKGKPLLCTGMIQAENIFE